MIGISSVPSSIPPPSAEASAGAPPAPADTAANTGAADAAAQPDAPAQGAPAGAAAPAPANDAPAPAAPAADTPAAAPPSDLRNVLPDSAVAPGILAQLQQVPADAPRSDTVQPRSGDNSDNPDSASDQNGTGSQSTASDDERCWIPENDPRFREITRDAMRIDDPALREKIRIDLSRPAPAEPGPFDAAGAAEGAGNILPPGFTDRPPALERMPTVIDDISPAPAEPGPVDAAGTPGATEAPDATAPAGDVDPTAAATPAAPTDPTAPAPTASPVEIAAYKLMLADPDIQNVIQNFGGPFEQLPVENGVEKSIVARYGAELAAQLNQFQTAQQEVRNQYAQALEQAIRYPGPNVPGATFYPISGTGDMGMGPIPPGTQALAGGRTEVWHYGGDANGNLGYWALDPVAFTDAWSQGDSPLQKAFTTLYGDHPVQAVSKNMGDDSGQSVGLTLAGQTLQIIPAPEPEDNTPQTGPICGVYNPVIIKATLGHHPTGGQRQKIDFGSLFASAVGRIAGQAGVQGVVQQLTGGKFLDGLTQGALNGLAGEISTQLNLKIKGNADLSASERSTLKLLSRASTSAIRALGNPGDPPVGFAGDFLSSLIPQPQSEDPKVKNTQSVPLLHKPSGVGARQRARGRPDRVCSDLAQEA